MLLTYFSLIFSFSSFLDEQSYEAEEVTVQCPHWDCGGNGPSLDGLIYEGDLLKK